MSLLTSNLTIASSGISGITALVSSDSGVRHRPLPRPLRSHQRLSDEDGKAWPSVKILAGDGIVISVPLPPLNRLDAYARSDDRVATFTASTSAVAVAESYVRCILIDIISRLWLG